MIRINTTNTGAHIFFNDDITAEIYFGNIEFCKTEAEALEAAELLKAFFEAKQEGQTLKLISEGDEFLIRREGYQTAMLEMQQAQSQPSDYQLRLERYAVDIYQMDDVTSADDAVNRAAEIMALAAKKSANQ